MILHENSQIKYTKYCYSHNSKNLHKSYLVIHYILFRLLSTAELKIKILFLDY